MAKIPQEAQDVFNSVRDVVFSTASTDAQPNSCIVGIKKLINDETIYLSDQFFKKTLACVQENPKVSVIWWGEGGAFQIHGTARYVNEGPEFEEQAAWANAIIKEMGKPMSAKGGVFVTVDQVFSSTPGPNAGAQLA